MAGALAHARGAGRREPRRGDPGLGKLGYPRRALRLREAAVAITERHGGVVPAEVDELESLPGIGTYTARAVSCFGYGRRQPVVDTNVRRVVARLVHGRAEAAPPSSDLVDVAGARAGGRRPGRPVLGRGDGAGRAGLRGRDAALRGLPGAGPLRVAAGRLPAHDGPARKVQRFAGTDRQVRGRLLDVLRAAHDPVEPDALVPAWDDAAQRSRCLDSLLVDGLVVQTDDGRFSLPG